MRRGALIAVVVVVTVLVAACGQQEPQHPGTSGPEELAGRTFVKDADAGSNGPGKLLPGTSLSVSFTRDGLSANAGCNTMGANFTLPDGVLVLDDGLSTTEMGCDLERMTQDAWVADFLSSRPNVHLDETTLTISNASTKIAMTDLEIADPDRDLVGTPWVLDSIAVGDIASSVPPGVSPTLRFTRESHVVAMLGCNEASGDYTLDGEVIKFGPIAQTLKVCGQAEMAVEDSVTHMLDGMVTYRIEGHTLNLTRGSHMLGYGAEGDETASSLDE